MTLLESTTVLYVYLVYQPKMMNECFYDNDGRMKLERTSYNNNNNDDGKIREHREWGKNK